MNMRGGGTAASFAKTVLMAWKGGLFDEDDDEDDDDEDGDLFRFPPRRLNPTNIPKPKPSRSVSSTSCGFDAKFIATLREEKVCPICQMALREPRLTVCGHHYCQDCLRPLLGPRGVTCPVCRTQLNESEVFPDNALKRRILDLKIRCDQHENGCEWIGELRDRETHNTTCGYVSVPCPQCGETILAIDFEKHEESCVRRIVSCCCCKSNLEYGEMEDHLTKCGKCVVACPYNCGSEMTREQLEHHCRQGPCSRVPIECEFKDAGCQFKGEKTALEEHVLTGVVSHLGLMMKHMREMDVKFMHEMNQRMLLMPLGQFIYMWKIDNWKQNVADAKTGKICQVESEKFYISHPKYRMYLKAYLNGVNITASGCVSLFLAPTPGEYDSQVSWPFSQPFSLSVMDQQPQGKHLDIDYSPPYKESFYSLTSEGWGCSQFVSHNFLSTRCYLKNDCIIIKLVVSV